VLKFPREGGAAATALLLTWSPWRSSPEEELEAARERARSDAEERFAYESSGREPDDQPGEQPPAYAAEDVQTEYARVYENTLEALRRHR
jgi:hypothetical protein